MRRQAEPALKDKSVSDSDTKKARPGNPGTGCIVFDICYFRYFSI